MRFMCELFYDFFWIMLAYFIGSVFRGKIGDVLSLTEILVLKRMYVIVTERNSVRNIAGQGSNLDVFFFLCIHWFVRRFNHKFALIFPLIFLDYCLSFSMSCSLNHSLEWLELPLLSEQRQTPTILSPSSLFQILVPDDLSLSFAFSFLSS